MPAKPPKALIFDLDGVLVDSEPLHRKTWLECLTEQGVQLEPGEESWLQGRTGEQVLDWLRAKSSTLDSDLLLQRKRALYRDQMKDGLTAIPGVDGFLRKQKNVLPLGLVTSSKLKVVGQVMLQFNWRNIFDALIGAEHVTNPKPHPEPYQQAAQRFKLPPAEILVFEDSLVGIQAARAAGMDVCAVASTLTPDALRSAGASWVIENFTDETPLEMAMIGHKPGKVFGFLQRLRTRT